MIDTRTAARRIASLVAPVIVTGAFAGLSLAPETALAEEGSRVESIAAKGHISPAVPVEGGLVLCLGAALVAVAMQRRSR